MMQQAHFIFRPFNSIQPFLQGFLHLFYPHICLQCATEELLTSQVICNQCESLLPYTQFSKMINNPVEKVFWGRAQIQFANAILYFTKDSIVQQIIYELKYKQNKKAGNLLGRLIAKELLLTTAYNHIDYIIPIPISKKKIRKRGFNQCQIICEAIIENGFKVALFNGLKKIKNTETQTHKDRLQRNIHSSSLFYLTQKENLRDKHILVIDDVLTTGATLEAAYHCIKGAKPAMIYVFTAAYTLD